MNKSIYIGLTIFVIVLFCSCGSLEGSEVIGPGGGYVFYDKGSYSDGWRYLESIPESVGELTNIIGSNIDVTQARGMAENCTYGGKRDWRLPTDDECKRMGEYFLGGGGYLSKKGGMEFTDKTYYVTSNGNVFGEVTITTVSNDTTISSSKFEKGSGVYKEGCTYFVHPIRQF